MTSVSQAGRRAPKIHRTTRLLAVASAAIAALALPAAASAASDPSTVSGIVGSEMSVSAPNTSLSSFSPSTDGTGSTNVTVSSTHASWTLTVADAGLITPGQMDRVDCTTRLPLTGSLAQALAYSGPNGSGSLSATPATVRSGALVEVVPVGFTQAIGASENLTAGECYQLQATFTAT